MSDAPYAPLRPVRTGVAELREGRFGWARWGPESVDPILVLHGWQDCAQAFQLLADALPAHWPLLGIDWLGHGRSEWRRGRYWFADRLVELDAVLAHFMGDRPVRIIGHSMGGSVAFVHAGLRPQATRWLVDIEGYGMPAVDAGSLPSLARGWLDSVARPPVPRRYRDAAQLAAALTLRNPRLPPAHALYLAAQWTRATDDGRLEMLADPITELRSPVRFARDEIEAAWARVTAPVLMMHGADSGFLARVGGEAALARWQALVPGLRSATIAGAGHLLPHERPDAVAAAVLAFAGADGDGPGGARPAAPGSPA